MLCPLDCPFLGDSQATAVREPHPQGSTGKLWGFLGLAVCTCVLGPLEPVGAADTALRGSWTAFVFLGSEIWDKRTFKGGTDETSLHPRVPSSVFKAAKPVSLLRALHVGVLEASLGLSPPPLLPGSRESPVPHKTVLGLRGLAHSFTSSFVHKCSQAAGAGAGSGSRGAEVTSLTSSSHVCNFPGPDSQSSSAAG